MPIHAFEFLKPKKPAQAVKPFYAVFGDDAYLRHESLKAIVHQALGADADLILVDPREYRLAATISGGKVVAREGKALAAERFES